MRKRRNFRKKKHPKEELPGIQVRVYNNNIEGALKLFKKKVKDSNLMLELKEKAYYQKPSEKRRERKSKAKLRAKYKKLKETNNF